MKIRVTGLSELQAKLHRLQRRIDSAPGPVALEDLFPPEFMRRYTDFKSIDEMTAATGRRMESKEDLQAVPDAEWEALVIAKTRFESWEAMQKKAGKEYLEARLGIDNL